MDFAVGIHDSLFRINMHARRTHVMPAAMEIGRRRFIFKIDLEPAEAGALKVFVYDLLGTHDAADVDGAQAPVQTDAILPQGIAFMNKDNPAVGIGNLFNHMI